MTLVILGFFDEKISFAVTKRADTQDMDFEHGYLYFEVLLFSGDIFDLSYSSILIISSSARGCRQPPLVDS
jgi:hypothetical protein